MILYVYLKHIYTYVYIYIYMIIYMILVSLYDIVYGKLLKHDLGIQPARNLANDWNFMTLTRVMSVM